MTAILAARAMKALAQNMDNTDAWEGITAKAWRYLIPWDRIAWCVLAHVDYRQSETMWEALESEERRRLRVTMLNIIKLFERLGSASEKGNGQVLAVSRADSKPRTADVPGGTLADNGSLSSEGKKQNTVAGSKMD